MNALKVNRKSVDKIRQEKEVDAYIDKSLMEFSKSYSIKTDVLTCYLLHRIFGFGKDRLKRFLDESGELQKHTFERYEDADLFAMEKHLKETVGIDVRQWVEDNWDNPDSGRTFL